MARRHRRPNSLAGRIGLLESQTWENTTQIIRRIGIEVTWAKIADVMISGEGIESSNFVAGVSGWKIDGDGNVEFQSAIIRGTLNADDITVGTLNVDRIAAGSIDTIKITDLAITNAKINDLNAVKITAGTLNANRIGANTITSDKLSVGSLDAITATMGTLTVNESLTMTPGGVFRTAASGERFEFSFTDRNRLFFYSGDADEAYAGRIVFDIVGSGASAYLETDWELGSLDVVGPDVEIRMTGVSRDNSSRDAGLAISTRNAGDASALHTVFIQSGNIYVGNGSASKPAYSFDNQDNLGMYRIAASQLGFSVGGALRISVTSSAVTLVPPLLLPAGSVTIPAAAFSDDPDTGIFLSTTAVFNIAVAGVNEFVLGSTGFKVQNVYDSTFASTANVHVVSDGRLYRATSTEEWKEEIVPWSSDGTILDVQPVTFYPMSGNVAKGEEMKRHGNTKFVGLTYENMQEHFPAGAMVDDKSLNWNAIVTALLSEVQSLRSELDEVKVSLLAA